MGKLCEDVKLGNIAYSIEEFEEAVDTHDGWIVPDEAKILLKRHDPQYMYHVFWHEMCHNFLARAKSEANLDLSNDEFLVDSLAEAISAAIKENPHICNPELFK